jgi:hypothetical protein
MLMGPETVTKIINDKDTAFWVVSLLVKGISDERTLNL